MNAKQFWRWVRESALYGTFSPFTLVALIFGAGWWAPVIGVAIMGPTLYLLEWTGDGYRGNRP